MNNMKKQSTIKTTIVASPKGEEALSIYFSNGEKLHLFLAELSPDIITHATLHGLKQKLVDAGAIARNTDTGQPASVEDKYNAVKVVYDRIRDTGQWNAPHEGGGGNGGLLFAALCKLYDKKRTPDEVREFLATRTDAEKVALRGNSKVAATIEKLRAASGKTSGIDSDALLGELS